MWLKMKEKINKIFPFIMVFLLPFVVYLPTLWGTFYYDDNVVFFGHQVERLSGNPFSVFTGEARLVPGSPRSLHIFMLLMIYKLFGASPLPYHAFNLLMHSTTTLLVYLFLKKLTSDEEGIAFAGALIFGLHPIHVENITFVTLGGTDIFYTLWAVASLLSYIKFREAGPRAMRHRRYAFLLLSVVFFYFSLLSKESAITMIIMFPATEIILKRRGFLWALPHAALIGILKWGFIAGSGGMIGKAVSAESKSILDVFSATGYFIRYLIIPYPQSPIIKEFGDERILYGILALSAASLLYAAFGLKRKGLVFYSAIWFIVSAVPYLFVPFVKSNISISAERYIYGPSVGFAFFLSIALAGLFHKENLKRYFRPAILSLLVIYAALGVFYFFSAWRNEEAFWRRAAHTNPDYVTGYTSLASFELEKGNKEEGRRLLMEGLKKHKGLPAEFAQAAYILGTIAREGGDLSAAESYYLLSLNYNPYEFSYIDLGFLYLDVGKPELAKNAFEGAMSFPARNTRAVYGLAKAYAMLGDRENALRYAGIAYERTKDGTIRHLAEKLIKESMR
jgi:tetratricopeptide (TPR) repeat protein